MPDVYAGKRRAVRVLGLAVGVSFCSVAMDTESRIKTICNVACDVLLTHISAHGVELSKSKQLCGHLRQLAIDCDAGRLCGFTYRCRVYRTVSAWYFTFFPLNLKR
jgi:hypothetical protein